MPSQALRGLGVREGGQWALLPLGGRGVSGLFSLWEVGSVDSTSLFGGGSSSPSYWGGDVNPLSSGGGTKPPLAGRGHAGFFGPILRRLKWEGFKFWTGVKHIGAVKQPAYVSKLLKTPLKLRKCTYQLFQEDFPRTLSPLLILNLVYTSSSFPYHIWNTEISKSKQFPLQKIARIYLFVSFCTGNWGKTLQCKRVRGDHSRAIPIGRER